MTCIPENIIGITDIDCDCYTDKPTDAEVSESGLFITDLLPLNIISLLEDCEIDNIWELMDKIRSKAPIEVQDDIVKCIKQKVKKRLQDCKTNIGDKKFTKSNDTQGAQYLGIRLSNFRYDDICAIIKSINVLIDTTTSFDVTLYSNQDTTPIKTWTVNGTANTLTLNPLNPTTEIPTYLEQCDDLEYYLVYEATFLPKNNKCDCGCGSWNKKCWKQVMEVKGIYGDDLTDLENWKTLPNLCNGLSIDLDLICKESTLICDEVNLETSTGRNIAKAVQYWVVIEILKKFYFAGTESIYKAICKEDIDVLIASYQSEYNELIKCICEDIDLSNSDCFTCANTNGRIVRL